ncbi:thiol-disulfide isomerase/thioredoxin [Motilibacter peucedani]|uniref:Thiol-disulfide isomerase/thioredoxin n=1 Tax=Motilibacter peucedani TaxID=598650 RepID=A0A420XUZ6_9ACTN|nr:NHL domain-containing thioredoxin family protein [Motilibacter peucedani]RKS80479.1 thiol-disulfide isomerase/thioredoxin [Motilibacter peucedani]
MSGGRARVRAPELARGTWIGTGGVPLTLHELRGRFVLLDFWTFACINCLHVIDELRELEQRWSDELVVLGIHSPKFTHEADADAVAAAVERYDVHHPVLDDAAMTTWSAYAVRAWPTLVLVDPEGYVVTHLAGEGHAHALDRILTEQVAEHERRGTLRRGAGPWVPTAPANTELRFPGKAVRLPERLGGGLLVSDSGRHGLVVLDDAGEVVRRIGSGTRGLRDGGPADAQLAEPQGLCVLPEEVAAAAGYDVVVSDTVNHVLRGLRLPSGELVTVAGSGRQWMQGSGTGDLSSPWDLAWWDDRLWVAMAGIHQLWTFDPRTGAVQVAAGTTNEGLVDGPAGQAWFSQPSGLSALGSDAELLWVADSESSALRRLRRAAAGGYEVDTVVGTGLFDFGHVDGPAGSALLQHPLGVAACPDGSVLVADTFNGALRRWSPDGSGGTVATVATGLAEPSDVLVDGDRVRVVESAAHRVRAVELTGGTEVMGARSRTQRPPTELRAGSVRLEVVFVPPPGQHLDERWGPATRLSVSSTPPGLLRSGEGRGSELVRTLELDASAGDGVLHVAATAAACDDAGENPACHVHQQDWGVPVRLVAGAPGELVLPLLGAPA